MITSPYKLFLILLVCINTFFPSKGSGQNHTVENPLGTPFQANNSLITDFNKDSVPEIIFTSPKENTIRRYVLKDQLVFQTYNNKSENYFINLSDIDVTDFDQDGDNDQLICLDFNSDLSFNGRIWWLQTLDSIHFNLNAVSFDLEGILDLVDFDRASIADFDANGYPDIVAVGDGSTVVKMYQNQGNVATTEKFKRFTFSPDLPLTSLISVGDLNSDGKPDIVGGGIQNIFYSLNTSSQVGEINFEVPTEIEVQGILFTARGDIEIADLNNDNFPEILTFAGSHDAGLYLFPGDVTRVNTPDSINRLLRIYKPISEGENWGDICVADIDNNGWNDIIFQTLVEKNIYILYQESEFNFREEIIEHNWNGTANGIRGPQMDVGDIDMDGDIDLVVPNNHPMDRDISWYENIQGELVRHYYNGDLPGIYMTKIGDIDLDGNQDIMVSVGKDEVVENEILMFETNGESIAQNWVIHDSIANPQDLALTYVDGDAYIDLAVVEYDSGKLLWLQNNQKKYAWEAHEIDDNLLNPRGIASGDLNNDEKEDILLASHGDNTVIAYKNQGGGRFIKEIIGEEIVSPIEVELFDWENDGDLDVAIVCENVITPFLILRNTPSNFEKVEFGLSGVIGTDIEITDWDGDLLPDILVSTTLTSQLGQVYFMKNQGDSFDEILLVQTENVIESLLARNVDQDKAIDLLLGYSDAAPNQLVVGFNRAGRIPNLYPLSSIQGSVQSISLLDINRDSIPEVFIADNSNKALKQVTIDPLIFSADMADTSFQNVDSLFSRLSFVEYGLNRGSVAWGDYDNDNDLDLLVTGVKSGVTEEKIGAIFRNDGANQFNEAGISLPKVSHGEAKWVDYTLDNRLDIMIGGLTELEQPFLALLRQTASGTFDQDTTFSISESFCTDWGDLDQNGTLDLVRIYDQGLHISLNQLNTWENVGPLSIGFESEDLLGCSVKLLDFNNDHRIDIALLAESPTQKLFMLYENRGEARFERVSLEGLLGLGSNPFLDTGDFNGDGYTDLLLSGDDMQNIPRIWIYENQGGDSFKFNPISIDGIERGQAIWGDVDNDGILDIVVSGRGTSGTPSSKIYKGASDGTFSILFEGLMDIDHSKLALGDFNKDKKLDIATVGINYPQGVNSPRFQVYQSRSTLANIAPEAPTNLREIFHSDGSLTLMWDEGEDSKTPTKSLSYNLFVGTSESKPNIISPESHIVNGFRMIPKIGNTGQNTSWTIRGLEHGEYYWGVQSIDGAFEGSSYAKKSFSFFDPNKTPDLSISLLELSSSQINPGDSLRINIQIDNLGLFRADSQQLGLFLSTDSLFQQEDDYLGTLSIPSLSGLGSFIVDTSIQIRLNLIRPGIKDYYILAIADVLNEIHPELSEENNTKFTSLVIGELEPIMNILPAEKRLSDQKIDIWVELEDVFSVDSAQIFYREISAPSGSEWNISTEFDASSVSVRFDIYPTWADLQGLEYQIQLFVNGGNSLTSDIQYLYRYFDESGITFSDIRGANPGGFNTSENDATYVRNYRILSIPLELMDGNVRSVFEDDLGIYDKKKWRIFRYIPSSNRFQEYQNGLNEVIPGEGLFFIQKENNQFNTGPGRSVDANKEQPFQISLQAGYNVIGNPFHYDLDWEEVILRNPQADFQKDLMILEGEKRPGTEIKRYRGALAFVAEDVTIELPIQAVVPKRKGQKQYNSLDKPIWEVPISLKTANQISKFGGIGMHPDASVSRDPIDRLTPPRFLDYLELNFYHPEFFWERFSKDVVPTSSSYTWNLTVEAATGSPFTTLEWDNYYFGENNKALWLYDITSGWGLDMRKYSEYSFPSQEKRPFQIFFGPEEEILENLPMKSLLLGQPYPNPSRKFVRIPIFIPPKSENSKVSMRVLDILGQKVIEFPFDNGNVGSRELVWDLTLPNGKSVIGGIYFIQLWKDRKFLTSCKVIVDPIK